MSHVSQNLLVQRHLAKGLSITPLYAQIKFGCMRLGARIWDLKRAGFDIHRRMVCVGKGKRVASYSIPRARK